MNTERAAIILKLALAGAALLAGAGIGYYFGLFLPHQIALRDAHLQAEQEARSIARVRLEQARGARAVKAQAQYRQCLADADLAYQGHWNTSCRAQHDADTLARADCMDDWFTTKTGCQSRHPVRPATHCALPALLANGFVADRDRRKDACQQEMQAAIAR